MNNIDTSPALRTSRLAGSEERERAQRVRQAAETLAELTKRAGGARVSAAYVSQRLYAERARSTLAARAGWA